MYTFCRPTVCFLCEIKLGEISHILCSFFLKMNSIPNSIILFSFPLSSKYYYLLSCSAQHLTHGFSVVSQKGYFVASLLLHTRPTIIGGVMGGSHFDTLYSPLHSQAHWFYINRMLSCSWSAF